MIYFIKNSVKKENDLGWASLRQIGSYIKKTKPNFNVKNHGYTKLLNLIKTINLLKIKLSKHTTNVRVHPNTKISSLRIKL
ncbi:OST-HTH/LOTUS domain-containing protein [Gilliamella apicola]|uniref:OST-HTH/LOTUS domain-containing protein n=1 Tax=unclassified Gilliamella TaxID=2685620 RepID=UPI001C3FFD36